MTVLPISKRSAAAWRPLMWGAFIAVLLTPLIVLLVTGEMQWTTFDFVVAGTLLGGTGLAIEGIARATGWGDRRWLAGVGVFGLMLLIWAHGAVGVF